MTSTTGCTRSGGSAWRWSAGLLAAWLAGCAASPASPEAEPSRKLGAPLERTAAEAASAASAPIEDLNLRPHVIPEVLRMAQHQPYAEPADRSCAALRAELEALDAALGPDVDAPSAQAKQAQDPLLVQGVEIAGDTAVNMVRHSTEALLPWRGWVRRLSGAEQHSRDWAAALAAGHFRRAFLKGYARAQGCLGAS